MPRYPSGRLPATAHRVLVLVLLLPLAILVLRYKSLWYDEASLGINIVTRSYGGLFDPLSYLQVAPIGFLLLSKLSNTLLGYNDVAIRLPSLAAYLGLFVALARRADRSPEQLLRFVLIAASPAVLRYAFELKQYISDVLLIVLLLEFGEAVFARAGRALVFSALAVTLSNVSFMQVPIFALLAGVGQIRAGVPLRTVALRLAAVAVPLGAYYLAFVAHHPSQAGMLAYWATELPFGPGQHENPAMFLARRLYRLVRFSYLTPFAAVLLLFYLGGVVSYLRERRYRALAASTLPILGHYAFALLGLYPFDAGRLTLYLIAPIAAGAATGVVATLRTMAERFSMVRRYEIPSLIGWVAVLALAANGLGYAVVAKRKEHIRPIFEALERRPAHDRASVPLHFLPKSTTQLDYYAAQAHAAGRRFLPGYRLSRDTGWEPLLRDAPAYPSVAAVLSHSRELFGGRPFTARQVEDEVARRLRERDPSDALGLRVTRVSWANGAALVEVERSRPPR